MAFTDPKTNINQLSLKEGSFVADFGCGPGAYVFELAKKVGSSGKVFALDVQREILVSLKNKAKDEGLANIDVLWVDLDEVGGSKLADATCDAAIISNVLFQSEHRVNFSKEVARVLKHGGEALVIDWSDSFGGLGPVKSQVFKADDAEKLFTAVGLAPLKKFNAGDHHWGMVFKKM